MKPVTMDDVLRWHEAGKVGSPRARSVQYTQVLLDEIARLKDEVERLHVILEDES